MRSKLLALVVALVFSAGVGWYFASPSLAMNGIKSAVMEGDKEGLEERIDFPSVRESLKSQMRAKLAAEMVAQDDDNPFAALGSMLAMGMIDGLVEGFVTPDALAELIRAGKMQHQDDTQTSEMEQTTDWDIERNGFDQFLATPKGIEGSAPSLIFNRDGLSWKLTEIRMPEEQAESETAE